MKMSYTLMIQRKIGNSIFWHPAFGADSKAELEGFPKMQDEVDRKIVEDETFDEDPAIESELRLRLMECGLG